MAEKAIIGAKSAKMTSPITISRNQHLTDINGISAYQACAVEMLFVRRQIEIAEMAMAGIIRTISSYLWPCMKTRREVHAC